MTGTLNLSCFISESQIIWLDKSLIYNIFIRVYFEINFLKSSRIRKYVENKQNRKKIRESLTFLCSAYSCFNPRTSLLKLLTFIRGSLGSFPFGSSPGCFRKTSGISGCEAILFMTLLPPVAWVMSC